MPSVAFITLGCKVNQYETQLILETLEGLGYKIVSSDEPADIFIINTCTVTNISDRKSRQMIRKAHTLNPKAKIIVTGCYAEREPGEIKQIEGVDLVLPNKEKTLIAKYLNDLCDNLDLNNLCVNRYKDQTRALVKIEDGCNSFCSYCIIPYVRGSNIRSRPIDSIIEEVQNLVKNGHKEIVLTGIHLGAYGKELNNKIILADVIRAVHEIKGLERIRLSSIEPMDVTDELIYEMSKLSKCAHHFHISLQSGSDRILRLMNRNYTVSDFENIINKIRHAIPDVGVTTDIMVGFPGETDQDFIDTYNFISKIRFSRLHVFRYSPRKGTPAAKMKDQVPSYISVQRSHEIISLGNRLAKEFQLQWLGKEAKVLIEDIREGKDKLLTGFTSNYIRVLVADATNEHIGKLITVRFIDIENSYMIASMSNF
ncbi:MAG: tRNA (N(6)-L-threonylcarbamoyladenosine(37)-C(2))-methylthiotransferase MtaB [bacterium]